MNNIVKDISDSRPSSAYSIFCGVIKHRPVKYDELLEANGFVAWYPHYKEDNIENDSGAHNEKTFIASLEKVYYPGFINCLFPHNGVSQAHTSVTKSYSKQINCAVDYDDKKVMVKYIDLFFFPGDFMIYCFKCDLTGFSISEISDLNFRIRRQEPEKNEFLSDLLVSMSSDECLNSGNKLKVYTIIEHSIDFSDSYTSDHLLFDLATCSPVGSSIGEGSVKSLQPSEDYFNLITSNHKISVFNNWSALSLFDSFVVLHKGAIYNYNWESVYFRLLYVHSLYIKSYLSSISKEFYLTKENRNLENEFQEFNRNFNLEQISYNFLPQIIYEKIRSGFNIKNELAEIRNSIERDYKKHQEKMQAEEEASQKRINTALFIVAILAVLSTVKDGAELLQQFFSPSFSGMYKVLTILAVMIIFTIVFRLLIKKK